MPLDLWCSAADLVDDDLLRSRYSYLSLGLITLASCLVALWIGGATNFLCRIASFCQETLTRRWTKSEMCSRGADKVCGGRCKGKFEGTKVPNGCVKELPDNIGQSSTQAGSSIMEQLVPEITQHMLSYLDYRSLCNVSMTNSCLRRVADDDNTWKALFHKDFANEQSFVVAPLGWKSHYAATKAALEANQNFYKCFHAQSLTGMGRVWLLADYVKCIHPIGELLQGYESIMEYWEIIFNLNQRFDFDLQEERARVCGNVAWVTLKEYVNSSVEPLLATNIFEFHEGHWYMVHRHSSLQLQQHNFNFLN